jgi:hypothetical protein
MCFHIGYVWYSDDENSDDLDASIEPPVVGFSEESNSVFLQS